MTHIVITGFIGEQPRATPRLLPPNAAQEATNTRLDDGALSPIRKPILEHTPTGADNWQTIYKNGTEWLGWDTVVHAAPGPVADNRLYFTGDGVPKMRVSQVDYDLAVPRPTAALMAATAGTGSGDVYTRSYVYTYVTSFGEESEPNPASNDVQWQSGQTVNLSMFFQAPPGGRVTKQRIYRSQTGQTGTYYYLIAERPDSGTDFVDTIPVDAFQEALPSASWTAPPDGLKGLISLPGGMMAAFVGRELYFSEPYHPHAWPEKYVKTLDFNIVGLGAIGTSIIVMTDSQPYLVRGTAPDTMQSVKLELNHPCINARSIVDLGYSIAYASHEGLIIIDGTGSWVNATRNLFTRLDWLGLSPASFIAAQRSGLYVAFYRYSTADGTEMHGTIGIYTGGEGYMVRTVADAQAVFFEKSTSCLFYLDKTTKQIVQLDPDTGVRDDLFWRSKPFFQTTPENYSCLFVESEDVVRDGEQQALEAARNAVIAANQAKLAAGPVEGEINGAEVNRHAVNGDILEPLPPLGYNKVQVSIYGDDKLIRTTDRINRVVRLPGDASFRKIEITVLSNIRIDRVAMATTVDELKVTP